MSMSPTTFYLPLTVLAAPLPSDGGDIVEVSMRERHQCWQLIVTGRYKLLARERRAIDRASACQFDLLLGLPWSLLYSFFRSTPPFLTPRTPLNWEGALVLRLRLRRIPP